MFRSRLHVGCFPADGFCHSHEPGVELLADLGPAAHVSHLLSDSRGCGLMCADSLSSQTKCECSTSTSAPSPSTSPLQGHNTTVSCRIIRPGLNSQEAELLLLILTTQKAASANVAAASNCRHRAALLPSPPFISPQHQSMDITTPPKIDGALSYPAFI